MVKKISNNSEYITTDIRLLAIAKLKLSDTTVRAEMNLGKEEDKGSKKTSDNENLKR